MLERYELEYIGCQERYSAEKQDMVHVQLYWLVSHATVLSLFYCVEVFIPYAL
jgi:hypothetical protein